MRLTEKDKRDLIKETSSEERREDFKALRANLLQLTPDEHLQYLTQMSKTFPSQQTPKPIVGDDFRI